MFKIFGVIASCNEIDILGLRELNVLQFTGEDHCAAPRNVQSPD